jgi:hypothetical protein
MPAEQLVQTPEFDQGDTIGKVAAYRIYRDLMPTLTNDIYETVKQAHYQVLKESGFVDRAKDVGTSLNSLAHSGTVAAGRGISRAGKAVANAGRSYVDNLKGGREIGVTGGTSRVGNTAVGAMNKATRGDWAKSQATRAGTGLALGGAGYAATKEANFDGGFAPQGQVAPQQAPQQEPQVSALQQMAQQKVMDYLQAQGYDLNQILGGADQGQNIQEQPMQGQDMSVKMANDAIRSQVDQHTNQLALSMLQQLGINVDNSGTDTASAQDQTQGY